MRWFLDTEFNEDGKTIELISIALVSEKLEMYYAVSADFNESRIWRTNPWVAQNVLPQLDGEDRIPRAQIRDDIKDLVLFRDKPEFWGYFADYDWVVFCQLFGKMIDLPKGMPMYCNDLKQLMRERGIRKEALPSQDGQEHNALYDARWVRDAWLWIHRA